MLSSWTRSRNFCKLGSTYFFFAIGEILSYFFSRNFINPYLKKKTIDPLKLSKIVLLTLISYGQMLIQSRHFNLLIKGFEWKFYMIVLYQACVLSNFSIKCGTKGTFSKLLTCNRVEIIICYTENGQMILWNQ